MKRNLACWALVLEFFQGDEHKTGLWFDTPNPLLGMITPQSMIDMRREYHMLRIIREQLALNDYADSKCNLPPEGWNCSRVRGHSGPCAASEDADE